MILVSFLFSFSLSVILKSRRVFVYPFKKVLEGWSTKEKRLTDVDSRGATDCRAGGVGTRGSMVMEKIQ